MIVFRCRRNQLSYPSITKTWATPRGRERNTLACQRDEPIVHSGELAFLGRFCSNSRMDTARKQALENAAGISVIAWGIVSIPLAYSTGFNGTADCTPLFVIWAGFTVRHGSRMGSFFALLFSVLCFVGAVATIVGIGVCGTAGDDILRVAGALCFVVWMPLNMAMLSEVRRRPTAGEVLLSDDGNVGTEHAADAVEPGISGALPPPIDTSQRWLPQFSLRSLFILAILVALGSALGMRPVTFPRKSSQQWITVGNTSKDADFWSLEVVAPYSGEPAVGCLRHWRRKLAAGESHRHSKSSGSCGGEYSLTINGRTIRPGRNFVLAFQEGDDEPQRMEIPKGEAEKIFGRQGDNSAIEKFWRDKIEPLIKALGRKSVEAERSQ